MSTTDGGDNSGDKGVVAGNFNPFFFYCFELPDFSDSWIRPFAGQEPPGTFGTETTKRIFPNPPSTRLPYRLPNLIGIPDRHCHDYLFH